MNLVASWGYYERSLRPSTEALIQMLEKVAEKTNRARIITKAEVFKLLQHGRNVVGCEYRKAGKVVKDCKIQTDIFRRILCHPWKG